MNRIIATVKQSLSKTARWVVRRSVTGQYWQPRCYTGDPNWYTPVSWPRRSVTGPSRPPRGLRNDDTCLSA